MSQQTQAEYRQLGKSGLRVSVPILGAMGFGSPQWHNWILDEEKSLPILKAAWDRGINTIDTANMYSNGDSERVIRKFIETYNIPREEIIIMTKAFFVVSQDPTVLTGGPVTFGLMKARQYVNQGGLSRAALFNQVEASLARLGTSYVDVLQIHFWDPFTPPEETMKALHDLVQSGKVRYIGASNLKTWQLAEMMNIAERNGWTKFVSIQVEHSLLYRNEEMEMIPYCNYKGIGVITYGPLSGGVLARPLGAETTSRGEATKGTPFERRLRDSDKTILGRVEELANKKGWTMSEVALAWSSVKVTGPIVGANKLERVNSIVTTGKTLSEDEIKYLEEPYEVQPSRR
ncbi:transporter [Ganoderma sinense ZZ0214-1]|uniref:Transporter n=1 Tax=Ganoderma sinense ZZ0214-1 TaxID=1077348 RepID=A0A2G8S060_9APHY|nr:transporter [Ganoderma sinense ZZ0214-1]